MDWTIKYPTTKPYLDERYKVSTVLLGLKRLEDETYEEYKERIKVERSLLDDYLKGVLIPNDE